MCSANINTLEWVETFLVERLRHLKQEYRLKILAENVQRFDMKWFKMDLYCDNGFIYTASNIIHYDNMQQTPCVQCGQLYPVGFSPSMGFQCNACDSALFWNSNLSRYDRCDNMCQFVYGPLRCNTVEIGDDGWTKRLQWCRDKMNFYTNFGFAKQRVSVGIEIQPIKAHYFNDYQIGKLNYNTQHRSNVRYQIQFPLTVLNLMFVDDKGCYVPAKIISSLYDPKFFALPYKYSHTIKFELNTFGAAISNRCNANYFQWIFATNDKIWRKNILETLNFNRNLTRLHQQNTIVHLQRYLNYIAELCYIVYCLAFECPTSIDMETDTVNDCIYITAQKYGLWFCERCVDKQVFSLCDLPKCTFSIHYKKCFKF